MSATIRKLASSEDELHEAAIDRTGFQNFGDPAYRQGLRALLDAFDNDRQLTATGWQATYETILSMLSARLYAQEGWAAHPEVLTIPIHRPVIIVGLPRTGSTALHRLLAADQQFQGLETWLSEAPMIRPPRESWQTHPAYHTCAANLEARYLRTPELRKAHDAAAGEVEQCNRVLMQSFMSGAWMVASSLPTYASWLPAQAARQTYRRYADVLRLIGAREPQKRWLLKCPYHMTEIQTLLEVFPDACIIQTHRDPLQVIPSLCSLFHIGGQDLEGEAARAEAIGPRQCAYWRNALERMNTAREQWPTQFFDVDHRQFLTDPLGTVNSIYEYFGLTLSPHTEHAMRAWVAISPTSRHGKHEYAADSWGVTDAQIRETFAEYRAQHQFN